MIPKKNKNKNSIPSKDNWFIYDFESLELIDYKFWSNMINNFLSDNRLEINHSYKTYKLETNYFRNISSNYIIFYLQKMVIYIYTKAINKI